MRPGRWAVPAGEHSMTLKNFADIPSFRKDAQLVYFPTATMSTAHDFLYMHGVCVLVDLKTPHRPYG